MKSYTWFDSTFKINSIQEGQVYAFRKNGTSLIFNLADISGSSDITSTPYSTVKMTVDSLVANYFYDGRSDGSLMLGYAYYQYDSSVYLNLTRECGHFMVSNTSSYYITGHRMIWDYGESHYLGMARGIQNGGSLVGASGTYTLEYGQEYYDYLEEFDADSREVVMFDYELSNDNSYYESIPLVQYYSSCFELTPNSPRDYYFRFGKNTSDWRIGYNEGIEKGREIGYQNGYDYGKSVGTNEGYYKGLAEGGNAQQGVFSIIGGAINTFTPVLNIEVLPNITLGTCISIPVIVTLIVIIFRIARG